ncbi:MAG: hypothetical protein MJZ16_09280 [Bacteroidales bacterium]|nr:hypothetical protein [Bacteroidales bacterium]
MKFFRTIFAILSLGFILTGCVKESEPVTPPSPETLKLDLSALSATTKAPEDDNFFTYASSNVLCNWHKIISDIACIPLKSFELVVNSTPVDQKHGTWEWNATFKEGLVTYNVILLGTNNKDKVDWELKVSKYNGFIEEYHEFTWITGWSSKDGKKGQWNVNVSPYLATVLVSSNWEYVDNQYLKVKLTYELDLTHCGIEQLFNQSYIELSALATDNAYTAAATVHYYQIGLGMIDVFIEWNAETGEGRIKSESKWHNSEWHCWGHNHENIEEAE